MDARRAVEVEGRWFGIRGRRILRPVLEIEAEGRRHRLLALLEHKPWAATDGEEWLAAFPWEGGRVDPTAAELAVGPDLSVELISAPQPISPPERAATEAERASSSPPRPAPPAPAPPAPPPTERLEGELTAAREHVERLRDELDRARAVHAVEVERLRASHAEAERDLENLRRERDAAVAAAEKDPDPPLPPLPSRTRRAAEGARGRLAWRPCSLWSRCSRSWRASSPGPPDRVPRCRSARGRSFRG
jgi:hypothetical protein